MVMLWFLMQGKKIKPLLAVVYAQGGLHAFMCNKKATPFRKTVLPKINN
jgi:hypothetical protein